MQLKITFAAGDAVGIWLHRNPALTTNITGLSYEFSESRGGLIDFTADDFESIESSVAVLKSRTSDEHWGLELNSILVKALATRKRKKKSLVEVAAK